MNLQLSEERMVADGPNVHKSAVNVLTQKSKDADTPWYRPSSDGRPPTERQRLSVDDA